LDGSGTHANRVAGQVDAGANGEWLADWPPMRDRDLAAGAGRTPTNTRLYRAVFKPELAILAGLALFKTLHGSSYRERVFSIALAVAVGLCGAWSYLATSQLFPSTIAAKMASFRELHWPFGERIRAPRKPVTEPLNKMPRA